MKKKQIDDEIDLIAIILTVWTNRYKIFLITLIFITVAAGYYLIKKHKFIATTKINKISIYDESLYIPYNSLINSVLDIKNIDVEDKPVNNSYEIIKNEINKDYLLNLFLVKINEQDILVKALDKFKFIDRDNKVFNNELLYFDQLEKLASKLKLNQQSKKDSSSEPSWTIQFETFDKDKWEDVLKYINDEINLSVQKTLIERFHIYKSSLMQLNSYKIEDINNKMNNAKNDYLTLTNKRLSFLKEQAAIARELDITKNTLEIQSFTDTKISSPIIANIQTSNPYYMRGYSMIEKEIELIENRLDKDNFTQNLFELNQKKREILQNKELMRVEKLFLNTPIFKPNAFKAANIIHSSTKYKSSISLIVLLIYAAMIGLFFGIIYIFLYNEIIKRR